MVGGKSSQKLLNLVVENILENSNRQLDASSETFLLIGGVEFVERLKFSSESCWILAMLLFELGQEVFSVFEEAGKLCRRLGESPLEVVSRPLNRMLDLVREVFQSAERNTFLGWVNDISVADSNVGYDDLGVAFSSKGS